MPSLYKKGNYWYARWQKGVGADKLDVRRSLRVTHKKVAKKMLDKLILLTEQRDIDPFEPNFDLVSVLDRLKNRDRINITVQTVQQAADFFYRRKAHLSNASVRNPKNRTMNNSGTYERAIDYFIQKNSIADLSPRIVTREHFENVIFRDVKPATMHFYFRHLRAWWNMLLDNGIVNIDYPAMIKNDLPAQKTNMRKKMLTERELELLFKAFDEDLAKKRRQKHWSDSLIQHWFKPLMAVYFYCGLRKHEAAFSPELPYSGLKWQNIFTENGHPVMIELLATKGLDERSVPIPRKCQDYLDDYFTLRRDLGYNLNYDSYIFIYTGTRKKGWPVTGDRAYREFKHYLQLAGLPNERSLHGMRHSRVTAWLEKGFNTSEAQFMAGHSNVQTTEGYTHLTGKNLLEKMRRMEKNREA
jgi:site-specific recombinase XerD